MSPIIAVGVKASDRKWERGNQNQNWVKTRRPTIDGMWVWPVLDCSEMVTLRPPGQQKARMVERVSVMTLVKQRGTAGLKSHPQSHFCP